MQLFPILPERDWAELYRIAQAFASESYVEEFLIDTNLETILGPQIDSVMGSNPDLMMDWMRTRTRQQLAEFIGELNKIAGMIIRPVEGVTSNPEFDHQWRVIGGQLFSIYVKLRTRN